MAAPNRPLTERHAEVWSFAPNLRRIVQQTVSDPWTASFEVIPERDTIACAFTNDSLAIVSLEDGKTNRAIPLEFQIKTGPHSLRRMPDGSIALLDDRGDRFHYFNPITDEVTSAPSFSDSPLAKTHHCWDVTGRYLALFTPNTAYTPINEPIDDQSESSKWHLIDVQANSLVASFQMPITKNGEPTYFPPRIAGKPSRNEIRVEYYRRLPIRALAVSPDASRVVIRDSQNGIWNWQIDAAHGTTSESITDHAIALAVHSENTLIFTDGIHAFQTDPTQRPIRIKGLRRSRGTSIQSIAMSSKENHVAVIDRNGTVACFIDGRQSAETSVPGANCGAFISQGDRLVVGTIEGDLVTLDTTTGNILRREAAHFGSVTAIEPMRNLNLYASASQDRMIHVWDGTSGLRVANPDIILAEAATKLTYHATTQRLAASGDSSVALLDCQTSEARQAHVAPLPHPAHFAVYSHDGTRLFVSDGSTVTIMNSDDGRRLFSLPATDRTIQSLSSDRDGPIAVLEDGRLFKWRAVLTSGTELNKEPQS